MSFPIYRLVLTKSQTAPGRAIPPRGSLPHGKQSLGRMISEHDFLDMHTLNLTFLARDALSARLFPITCGMNLFNEETLGSIYQTVNIRPWHSIALPSAPAVLPWQYIGILPELFVHLYYFGAPFAGSLLRTWAKSPEARQHTGFILMDRPSWGKGPLEVSKLEHAPHASRPLGFELPMIPSLCGCWDQSPRWAVIHTSEKFDELFCFFTSTCCSLELHIAIFKGNRNTFNAHGTIIMQEVWDLATERFTFDPLTMVEMKVSMSRKPTGTQEERPTHDKPWTIAGQNANKPRTIDDLLN
ncbi:hypothetical protein FRC07_006795 [Ceratobasidium sp. 392]|nr:hypothetical protein FRC07_006795 [Ceratobasidium sp. 392]